LKKPGSEFFPFGRSARNSSCHRTLCHFYVNDRRLVKLSCPVLSSDGVVIQMVSEFLGSFMSKRLRKGPEEESSFSCKNSEEEKCEIPLMVVSALVIRKIFGLRNLPGEGSEFDQRDTGRMCWGS
jgi:hypothetical protein